MLRKKCKVYCNIPFRRVDFKLNNEKTNTVCVEKCKFCGDNINHRYCEKVEIRKHRSLNDVCCKIDRFDDKMSTSYIPDQNLCY